MLIRDVYDLVDKVAPFRLQEEYDNAGLITGSMDDAVHGVLLCLDVTHETVAEAHRVGADLILSHHPPIFRALKRLDPVQQSSLLEAVRTGVALMAAHTNFDVSPDGLNAFIVHRMGLTGVQILEPRESDRLFKIVTFVPARFREQVLDAMFGAGAGHVGSYARTSFRVAGTGGFVPGPGAHPFVGEENVMANVEEERIETIVPGRELPGVLAALHEAHPYEEPAVDVFEEHLAGRPYAGIGHVGNLAAPLNARDFVSFIKSFFGLATLPVVGALPGMVERVAFCSGAGSSVIPAVRPAGTQVLISGDITYHTALDVAQSGGCIVVVDHYSSERFFASAMEQALRKAAEGADLVPLYRSSEDYQPVTYW
jgi:dinuclear metal center YbgI/SA1388 family protein